MATNKWLPHPQSSLHLTHRGHAGLPGTQLWAHLLPVQTPLWLHISHGIESSFLACPALPSSAPCWSPYGDLCVSTSAFVILFFHLHVLPPPRISICTWFKTSIQTFLIPESTTCFHPYLGEIPFLETPAHVFVISLYYLSLYRGVIVHFVHICLLSQ